MDVESSATTLSDGSEVQRFRLGCASMLRREGNGWGSRETLRFDEPWKFWSWLGRHESTRRPVWLFTHNAGYDVTLLDFWSLMDTDKYSVTRQFTYKRKSPRKRKSERKPWSGTVVTGDPPTIICVRSERGTLRIVDSLNYFKCSLEELGIGPSLAKLPMPAADDSAELWSDYCMRDVEIVERAMCGLISEWEAEDCGNWKTTAAGLAFAAFRHSMPAGSIVIDHGREHTVVSRGAYYGGEVAAYWCGVAGTGIESNASTASSSAAIAANPPVGPFHLLDVAGFYPSIMRDEWFPCKFLKYEDSPPLKRLHDGLSCWCATARVLVDSRDLPYPVRRKGQVYHATGRFWTDLAGPELTAALSEGKIEQCARVAWYLPGRPFVEFVDHWRGVREAKQKAGNHPGEALAKLIVNSLSGKLGQLHIRWADRPERSVHTRWGEWPEIDATTQVIRHYRGIAGHCQEEGRGGEGKDSVVAIAAYITSYGRRCINNYRNIAGVGDALYVDTDALIVTDRGRLALAAAGQLGTGEFGRLRPVWSADTLAIGGPKDYIHDDTRVIAGLKASAVEVSPGVYWQERFQRLEDVISQLPKPEIVVTPALFSQRSVYAGRAVQPDGWTVPLEICDPDTLPF